MPALIIIREELRKTERKIVWSGWVLAENMYLFLIVFYIFGAYAVKKGNFLVQRENWSKDQGVQNLAGG